MTTFVHLSALGTIKTNYHDPILIATNRDFAKTHANPDPPAGGTATN
ncbi:MAG: hypothetical protein ABR927_15075 [Bacteroidales bacterium]|jgi:hypothetical protein